MKKIIHLFLLIITCGKSQKSFNTSKEFKNNVEVSKELYKTDSINILNKLNKMVLSHEDFFYSYPPEFVDTTLSKVKIDTILYNKEKNKQFVLISVEFVLKEFRKNVDGKSKILNNIKLYDGMGIYVYKVNNSTYVFKSYGIEAGNYEIDEECKSRLNEIYFTEIPSYNQKGYNLFNIDDKRMWNQPMWEKIKR